MKTQAGHQLIFIIPAPGTTGKFSKQQMEEKVGHYNITILKIT